MTPTKRRTRKKENMRALILDAAKELFLRHGIEQVTMRQIAARIDYSPAAIYRYFKSKGEIFAELQMRAYQRFSEGQLQHASEPNPVTRLRKLGRQYISFAINQPDWFKLLFVEGYVMEVECQAERLGENPEEQQLFERTVAECMEAGALGGSDMDATTAALWGMVHGMACLYLSGSLKCYGEDIDVLDLFDRAGAFVMRSTPQPEEDRK